MKLLKSILLVCLLAPLSGLVNAEKAVFAGGCFWCVESDFQDVPGVTSAVSGYTGGHLKNPTYKDVTHGETGHYEAVEITFDENVISYEVLLKRFWHSIDPVDSRGQFCDKGSSYRSAIFTFNDKQTELAEASKSAAQKELEALHDEKVSIVTPILAAQTFYPAEDYHQDYYKVNSKRYKFYRWRCGRDDRLETVWGNAK